MAELTRDEIRRLGAALDQRFRLLREEVLAELERVGETHYIELAGAVHDTADESMADLLSDLNAECVHRQLVEMRDIEAALQRVREGEYGACVACGGEIGFGRLRACPTASRCIACQTTQERMFARTGQPSL